MGDRVIVSSGDWSIATDGLQWIVQRRRVVKGKTHWKPVSYVRSTKEILERCLRDAGVSPSDAAQLLVGLPSTFDEWLSQRDGSLMDRDGAVFEVGGGSGADQTENRTGQAANATGDG